MGREVMDEVGEHIETNDKDKENDGRPNSKYPSASRLLD